MMSSPYPPPRNMTSWQKHLETAEGYLGLGMDSPELEK